MAARRSIDLGIAIEEARDQNRESRFKSLLIAFET